MSRIKNSVLGAAEDMVELRLKRGTRDSYLRLVVAGMDAAMHGGQDSFLVSLKGSEDPIYDSAAGALDICLRLRKQDGDSIPLVTTVAAARALMIHALNFAEGFSLMTIGCSELVHATNLFNDIVFGRLMLSNRGPHSEKIERAVAAVVWLPLEAAAQ